MSDKSTAAGKKARVTMRVRILLTMVLVSLIPLGGLWYISLFKAEQEAISSVYMNIKNSADVLAEKVDGWYDTNLLIIEQNSRVPAIRSMVANPLSLT